MEGQVKSSQMMEKTLDELIANAALLKECEEEKGQCVELEHQQERLLNALIQMNHSLDESELQNAPHLYAVLEQKIGKFSRLNHKLLRPFVKKARVHKKKKKQASTQLSLEF
jgi:hypothetical protein